MRQYPHGRRRAVSNPARMYFRTVCSVTFSRRQTSATRSTRSVCASSRNARRTSRLAIPYPFTTTNSADIKPWWAGPPPYVVACGPTFVPITRTS